MSINDEYDNNETISPTILELCIQWGQAHLIGGDLDETEILEQIELAFRSVVNETDPTLENLLTEFESQVDEALEELSDNLTLALDPDAASEAEYGLLSQDVTEIEEPSDPYFYACIRSYLQTLDNTIYLCDAVLHFAPFKNKPLLQERICDLAERTVVECPPSYRLIPLNPMRRSTLQGLPERVHYLFPWYTEWCNVPNNALSLLADHLAGNPVPETEMKEEDLQILWREIESDEPMREHIVSHASTIRNLPEAMHQAFTIRWLLAAKDAELENEIPEAVIKADMVGAAIRVAVESILNGASPFEWRFRAGFCGVGLTDKQRFNILKPIELTIKEAGGVNWQNSGHLVQQWVQNKLSDQNFGEAIFKDWIHDLNKAAFHSFIPLFSEETIYWWLLRMDDPLPLAQAIRGLDDVPSLEPLQKFCMALQPPDDVDNIPAGFCSLVSYLARKVTTLDTPGTELYDQWIGGLAGVEKMRKFYRALCRYVSRPTLLVLSPTTNTLFDKAKALLDKLASKLCEASDLAVTCIVLPSPILATRRDTTTVQHLKIDGPVWSVTGGTHLKPDRIFWRLSLRGSDGRLIPCPNNAAPGVCIVCFDGEKEKKLDGVTLRKGEFGYSIQLQNPAPELFTLLSSNAAGIAVDQSYWSIDEGGRLVLYILLT
jgi:hypothetical protein